MAITTGQVSVSSTATALTSGQTDDAATGFSIVLKNTGSTDVFLGGSGVTTATGFVLAAGSTFSVDLGSGEQLFAVAAVTGTVHVLRVGV